MATIRTLTARSATALTIILTTTFLAACNDSNKTPAAKSEASNSTKAPAGGADATAPKTMSAEDSSKTLDALKKSLSGASSADMQKKSEELWTAKDYASAVAIAEMAYKSDGNKNAAYRLGTAYYGGTGVEKNLGKAAGYLNTPGLDDVSYALYYRGLILADKSYSGFDAKKARASLEKAKQMGVAEADDALKALPAN
jgi:TPR repeat protein